MVTSRFLLRLRKRSTEASIVIGGSAISALAGKMKFRIARREVELRAWPAHAVQIHGRQTAGLAEDGTPELGAQLEPLGQCRLGHVFQVRGPREGR